MNDSTAPHWREGSPDLYGRHSAIDNVCHRTDVRCHVEQFKRHHPDRPLPVTPTRHALVVVAS